MKTYYRSLGVVLVILVLLVLFVPDAGNTIERLMLRTLAGLG